MTTREQAPSPSSASTATVPDPDGWRESTVQRPPTGRVARFARGPESDPAWARPALFVLLALSLILYAWDLAASGWANAFYSAAVQAGSESWQALFYGSSDAGNSITVDKPPASLWVMGASVRLFGLNSWSLLLPQALMGVATVGLLYAAVKRWFGAAAGLLAGATLALTPVAVLMFRFNNPDALLVLLLVGAAYAVLRALETASTRWLLLGGVLVGFGFLTKMLQAFLVLPVFALVYLVAAPTPVRRRIAQLLGALAATIVSAGWWVAIVELVPASSRPFIGGSQTNSVLDLVFGYNGLGRLTGNETGSVTGGGTGPGSMWGATGWARMFDGEIGGQIAWLIPAALLMLVGGLWLTRGRPRTDRRRAAYLLWVGWLLVTGLVFSFMQGIFHAYYTVALAPAVAALVGMGGVGLWTRRAELVPRVLLASAVAVTAVWSWRLLDRSADWNAWLGPVVLLVGLAAAVVLLAGARTSARVTAIAAGAGLVVALAGPAAYAVETAVTPESGSIVTAGPSVSTGQGGPGTPGGRGGLGGLPGGTGPGAGGAPGQPGPGGPPAGAPQGGPGQLGVSRGRGDSSDRVVPPARVAGVASCKAATPIPSSWRSFSRTPTPTVGLQPPWVPTARLATSWRLRRRSCRSAASTAATRHRHSRSSRPTSRRGTSTTSSVAAALVPTVEVKLPTRSRAGWLHTSPHRPLAVSPSTT